MYDVLYTHTIYTYIYVYIYIYILRYMSMHIFVQKDFWTFEQFLQVTRMTYPYCTTRQTNLCVCRHVTPYELLRWKLFGMSITIQRKREETIMVQYNGDTYALRTLYHIDNLWQL